ncbi:LCP family protein, partial [Candidatus Saccharibacteria bacterium]|nr:LCP family protein [Candidatus Saccharibacteria bacterium]
RILAGVMAMVIGAGSLFAFVKLNGATSFVAENFGTVEAGEPVKEVARESFIMYISGIDERDGSLPEKSRSDLNILAVVNPAKRAVMLVNIPRDYYVEMAGMGQMDKLTHAGDIGGLALSMSTIEQLLDVKINYATRVNFNLLEGLVDAVGGVTIDSEVGRNFSLYWEKDCVIHDGANELDGRCAVAYARERLALGGDLRRAENQEKVIMAVFEKIAKDKSLLLNYEGILESLDVNFETSFTGKDVTEMVKYIAENGGSWSFVENNLEVSGAGEEYGVMFPDEKKFVYYADYDSVNRAHDRISAFLMTE